MSRWFRHYAGMMRDEKLVSAAVRSRQPVERVVWVYAAILESAAEIDDGGRYEFDAAEAAYFLRADEADICAVVDALAANGRLAEGVVVNWSDRQYQSDKSASRQAAYRERKRQTGSHRDASNCAGDGGVTASDGDSLSRYSGVTPQETDTDTDTEREKDARAQGDPEVKVDPPHWREVQSILETKSGDVDEWELDFLHSIKWKPSLTKPQADSLKAIQGKLASAGVSEAVPKQVVVIEDTAAWKAWEKYRGKRPPMTDIRIPGKQIQKGWYFPSEYPPSAENEAAA